MDKNEAKEKLKNFKPKMTGVRPPHNNNKEKIAGIRPPHGNNNNAVPIRPSHDNK